MKRAVPPAPTLAMCGFTLTEMAVVLVIVALLIGGMILPLSTQMDLRNVAETRKQLSDIVEALYGFAASHPASDGRPYLPCPDTDGDGIENRSGGSCANQEGKLPWSTLGLGRQDAWGNPFRYRVTASFSNSMTGFTLLTGGDMRVCTTGACIATLGTQLPAVILSTGKNGLATPTDADELANLDGNTDFVMHDSTNATSFDDQVVWLPPTILFNRMVTAGRLP
ncbi:type II secretion system protein [Sulfuricystis multivorans]|uniref:type II secretion system protein n=1 Tax=Sulfuricystis multivorans TaxID=2211108 RepID=UPI0024DF9878|nr:type II secretion system protein [Sulfuricystis multivorans]